MVNITNGKLSRYVSTGAFNSIYKNKGYYIVGTKPEKKVVEELTQEEPDEVIESVEEVTNESNEEDWVTELLEKPISQWTKEETASFAKEKGIDTSNAHKLSEAKDIIKEWLDEQSR